MPALCPLCVLDDFTSEHVTEDGIRYVQCDGPDHVGAPFVWEPSQAGGSAPSRGGIGAELDIWDKLLGLFRSGDGVLSYGDVEDRLFSQYPETARILLDLYGHAWRDPDHPATGYSMSAYLAGRLRDLEREGHLVLSWGPAEGPWSYNGIISHWRLAGDGGDDTPPDVEATATTEGSTKHATPETDLERIVEAARGLPPAEGDYTETDFVMNLFETVLDYMMQTPVVVNALEHYKEHHWDAVRTLADVKAALARFPDSQKGNTDLAKHLWGNKHWTRAHQLRDLVAFFESEGITDQESLEAWAKRADFTRDFQGRVKGLGPAVFQWLVMRQGVDTVKPDVHVLRFVSNAIGRDVSDTEAVSLVEAAARALGISPRELDWRIWEASRGGSLEYPRNTTSGRSKT